MLSSKTDMQFRDQFTSHKLFLNNHKTREWRTRGNEIVYLTLAFTTEKNKKQIKKRNSTFYIHKPVLVVVISSKGKKLLYCCLLWEFCSSSCYKRKQKKGIIHKELWNIPENKSSSSLEKGHQDKENLGHRSKVEECLMPILKWRNFTYYIILWFYFTNHYSKLRNKE